MAIKLLQSLKNKAKTLRNLLYHRVYIALESEKNIVDQFHKLYYDSHAWGGSWINTFWFGCFDKEVSIRFLDLSRNYF